MNELGEFCTSIPDFAGWSHADKIKLFAWFLHSRMGRGLFTSTDIRKCYEALNAAQPTAISPFLNAMVTRRPAEVLRSSGGYTLERRVASEHESRYGQRASTTHVRKLLAELPSQVPDLAERAYLDETLICFQHLAFRAAVVMCWNLTFDHLCHFILRKHLSTFNTQLPKRFPKETLKIAKRDDFAELKESQVLEICRSAGIIPDGLSKILKEKLDRRNMAAHPSGVKINDITAEEIIRDLIENVVLRLV